MAQNSSNIPRIRVGKNFEGQIAIGEYIVQLSLTDCIFVFPDGTERHGQAWRYLQGERPTTNQNQIFGRRQELEEIARRIQTTSALALIGLRGIGKSTVASLFVERLNPTQSSYAGIYWRTIDDTTTFGDIVGSFFTVIGKPIKELEGYKIQEQVAMLCTELRTAPYLLVLDNFERILNPMTNVPTKPGFSDFIEKMRSDIGKSRVLLTSWERPASERGLRLDYYVINGLDENASIALLQYHGVRASQEELKEATRRAEGHPLALMLLAQLIDPVSGRTLQSILEDDSLWQRHEVASRILDKVYEERLNDAERRLLCMTSVYRKSVSLDALVAVSQNPRPQTEALAYELGNKSVLNIREGRYSQHSLIHRYAYDKLEGKEECHRSATQYYLSQPILSRDERRQKDDVQPLIEAHYHACQSEDYEKAYHIIFENYLHEDLTRWGHAITITEMCQALLPTSLESEERLLDNTHHGKVLATFGRACRLIGEVTKAIDSSQRSLRIAQETDDYLQQSFCHHTLAQAYRNSGELYQAKEHHTLGRKISRSINDRRGECEHLLGLGSVFRDLGHTIEALHHYQSALEISRRLENRELEAICLSKVGIAFQILRRWDEAITHSKQALTFSRELGDLITECDALGNLAFVYVYMEDYVKAKMYAEKAITIDRRIGNRRGEAIHLGFLTDAYSNLGNIKKSLELAHQGIGIGKEIGDPRPQMLNHLRAGTLHTTLREFDDARFHWHTAYDIAVRIKDSKYQKIAQNNLSTL